MVRTNDDHSEGSSRSARTPAQPCIRLIREDRNHDAVMRIAAKLRDGGPILQSGLETTGVGRVTATSDCHRQSLAQGCQSGCAIVTLLGAIAHAARKTMIVALARKLLIALWRLVTTGEVPEGVILRPAA